MGPNMMETGLTINLKVMVDWRLAMSFILETGFKVKEVAKAIINHFNLDKFMKVS